MKQFTLFIIALFCLIKPLDAFGQAFENELKILSWNIYMLPSFPMMTGQKARAEAIVEVLKESDYDIIAFQEAFNKKSVEILRNGLTEQYPHQVGPVIPPVKMKASSGLWILSKVPIEEVQTIKFVEATSWDKMSQKGAVMVQTTESPYCQIVVTHLQSALDIERNRIRRAQCQHIKDSLITPNKKDQIPQILVGDWNVYAESAFNSNSLLSLLGNPISHHRHIKHTYPTEDYSKSEKRWTFDYAFVLPNGITDLQLNNQTLSPQHPWKKNRQDLSDHYALEVEVRW